MHLILIINIALIYLLHDDHLEGISSFFLFLQNLDAGQIDFFTESWSLSIEEFAYIIGPVLLLAFFYLFKKTDKGKLFIWVVLFIIVLSVFLRFMFHLNEEINDYEYWSHNLRKVVMYRIDSIYYGFIAAYISMNWKSKWSNFRIQTAIVGILMFFGTHFVIFKFNLLPENASFFIMYFICQWFPLT